MVGEVTVDVSEVQGFGKEDWVPKLASRKRGKKKVREKIAKEKKLIKKGFFFCVRLLKFRSDFLKKLFTCCKSD